MSKYQATIYLRLSHLTETKNKKLNPKDESDSIANQRKFIIDFVKSNPDIELVSEKIDDGYTGMIFERPAFKEMIEDIEAGKTNCVIVKDMSRLGREYIELSKYLREVFPVYNVRFIAINDNLDTAQEDGYDEISVNLKAILNDNYCKDISDKTKSSLLAKRKNGEFIGSFAMYGYLKSKENKNQLIVDPYASKIVKRIFSMKIKGSSANSISDILNAEGILSPLAYRKAKGIPHAKNGITDSEKAKWSATAVFRILKNPVYIGTLEQGKVTTKSHKIKEMEKLKKSEWIVIENAHEPIITKHIFNLAQDILVLETRTSPSSAKVHIFSGVLICGCCGKRMTRKTVPSNGKEYYYYHCSTGKKKGCYAQNMMKEQVLIDCVTHSIQAHIYSLIGIHDLLATIKEDSFHKAYIKKLEAELQAKNQKIQEAQSSKTRLYEQHLANIISKNDIQQIENAYQKEAKNLHGELKAIQEKLDNAQIFDNGRYEWLDYFKNYGEIETLSREIVVQLLQSIVIFDKKNLTMTFRYQDEYKEYLQILQQEKAAV